jgi:MYXO-CTERM domain-containing protein
MGCVLLFTIYGALFLLAVLALLGIRERRASVA